MGKDVSFSVAYRQFWENRGKFNLKDFAGWRRPNTEPEITAAQARTALLLDLLQRPDFETVRDSLSTLFARWMRGGLITEEHHIKLVSTFERITDGETREEFLAKQAASKPA